MTPRAAIGPVRSSRCRRDQPADHQVQRRLVEYAASAGVHRVDRRPDHRVQHAVAAAVLRIGFTLLFAAITVTRTRAAVMERRIRSLLMAQASSATEQESVP